MQESWFCAQCKSMNRATSQQCYKCRAPKAGATLATVADRPLGVVLTPGLDEEHREVAWTLMFRQSYVSAWKLGYAAAALLFAIMFSQLWGKKELVELQRTLLEELLEAKESVEREIGIDLDACTGARADDVGTQPLARCWRFSRSWFTASSST